MKMTARQRAGGDIMSSIIDAIEKEQLKTDVTNFKVGDGVRVHTRVVEGDKERIQIFAGIVIGRKGPRDERDVHRAAHFLRRRGRAGVPAPFAAHREGGGGKAGRARRAKLNYLRDRKGKEATAVRE